MRFTCVGLFVAALLALLVSAPLALAQGAADQPVEVDVTIAVVSFGNYDAQQGSYVLDFYLVLRWDTTTAPPDFTPGNFEFASGRSTDRELQADEMDNSTGIRALWYRVQANLYSQPNFEWYPFDKQTVQVRLEDTTQPESQLVYVANTTGSGLEGSFQAAGWEVKGKPRFTVTTNEYSFDDPYSQARFVITLQRSVLSGVLKVIVPPLAFVAISAVSFILLGKDKIATRFVLSGNMAISGILFHAAQSASLPSLSHLIFLDRYMLAIETFLFGSVVITALVALADLRSKDPAKSRRINWRGAVIVSAAAVGVFFLLSLVDVAPKVT